MLFRSPTASPLEGNGFTDRREEHHPQRNRWHEWDSNPQSPRFELGRFAGLAYRADSKVAQEGFEPSASLVLSESGLPVAYRAVISSGRLRCEWSGSRGTRTHNSPEANTCFRDRPLIRPDDFRISISQLRGLESNQRPPRSERGVTTSSNCPGVLDSGRRIRTSTT